MVYPAPVRRQSTAGSSVGEVTGELTEVGGKEEQLRKGDVDLAERPSAGASLGSEQLGDLLRDLRKQRGWTLADVSTRTGLAISTLSKVENNKNSLTYNNLARLAAGLNLDLAELLTPTASGVVSGHSTSSLRGTGKVHETPNYAHEYLCVDLARRRMVPMLSHIKARSLEEFGPLISHPGEEFFYVTEGVIDVYLEGQQPVRLRAGDSFYFDSSVAHGLVSVGAGEAYTLTVICPTMNTSTELRFDLKRPDDEAR